jgi:hypothetical protein
MLHSLGYSVHQILNIANADAMVPDATCAAIYLADSSIANPQLRNRQQLALGDLRRTLFQHVYRQPKGISTQCQPCHCLDIDLGFPRWPNIPGLIIKKFRTLAIQSKKLCSKPVSEVREWRSPDCDSFYEFSSFPDSRRRSRNPTKIGRLTTKFILRKSNYLMNKS